MGKKRISYGVGAVVVVMVTAILACNSPVKNEPRIFPSMTALEVPAETPTQTTIATLPQATLTPTSGAVPGRVEYFGVSFDRVAEVYGDVNATIVSLQTGEAGETGWMGSSPEYYQFELNEYALASPWIQPKILVYPVREYAAVNPPVGEIAAKLNASLREARSSGDSLPFLPMWNAGEVFHAQTNVLSFQNGKGLRYLTCYAQAMVPVDEECLFYTFQGLTQDGLYYIAAILPVAMPDLHSAEITSQWQALSQSYDMSQYQQYLEKVKQTLESAGGKAFSPDLKQLDTLITSLLVTPSITLKAPPVPEFNCPGALATRLAVALRARVTFTDGTPLRVREAPGKSSRVLKTIPEGTEVFILEGPQCKDGGVWWRMQTSNGSVSGWVMEGEKGVYYLERLE